MAQPGSLGLKPWTLRGTLYEKPSFPGLTEETQAWSSRGPCGLLRRANLGMGSWRGQWHCEAERHSSDDVQGWTQYLQGHPRTMRTLLGLLIVKVPRLCSWWLPVSQAPSGRTSPGHTSKSGNEL